MSNRFPVVDSEEVDRKGQTEERIMLALRTAKGLDIASFNAEFNCDFEKDYESALQKNEAYLEKVNGYLRIKGKYLYVQNTIICDFLS